MHVCPAITDARLGLNSFKLILCELLGVLISFNYFKLFDVFSEWVDLKSKMI
jgi:hypothetical protein